MRSCNASRKNAAAGSVKKWLTAVLRIVLAGAAVWAVRRELHVVDFASLTLAIANISHSRLALGAACTIASFLVLGVIEWMALRQADGAASERVPMPSAIRTGFVANALSQSIGLAVLTGTAVRVRAYARYGLGPVDVARTTAFVTITATLGLLAAGAVAVFANGAPVTVGPLSFAAIPAALALTGIVAAYLLWSVAGRSERIGWGRWGIPRPSPALAFGQTTISALDWLVTGAVLYAFMPMHIGLTLGVVLGAYLVAQVVAVTSHVPAGAGIFELVVVAILIRVDPAAPRAALAAALVMFRVAYYLIPLCAAVVLAAAGEFAHHGSKKPRTYEGGAAATAALDHAG